MSTLKLSGARDIYFGASQKVSDVFRQLALAGIGLVWVFKGTTAGSLGLDPKLIRAALFLITGLSCDLLQYVLTAFIWFAIFRTKEKRDQNLDQEFTVPSYTNWPNQTMFCLKIVCLVTAYGVYIIPYVWWRAHF